MPGLILPKHKVATQRIPEYDVDEVQLREPRLMVPGMVPLGPVKLDMEHPAIKLRPACIWFSGADVNLVTGSPLTTVGTVTKSSNVYGAVSVGRTNGNNYLAYENAPACNNSAGWCAIVFAKGGSVSANSIGLIVFPTGSVGSGTGAGNLHYWSSGGVGTIAGGSPFDTGNWYFYSAGCSSSGRVSHMRNAVEKTGYNYRHTPTAGTWKWVAVSSTPDTFNQCQFFGLWPNSPPNVVWDALFKGGVYVPPTTMLIPA